MIIAYSIYKVLDSVIDSITAGNNFGGGTGPTLLSNVNCAGSERRLADCASGHEEQ